MATFSHTVTHIFCYHTLNMEQSNRDRAIKSAGAVVGVDAGVDGVKRIKFLTEPEVAGMLRRITHPRDRAMFTVAYWRGLRASEIGMLALADYTVANRRLYVHRAKGGISGQYLLHDDEVKALRGWLAKRGDWPGPLFPSERRVPISRSQLHRLMRTYCERAAVPMPDRHHFHSLRHSIAVHLIEAGMELLEVKDWLGHRSIASTMVYAAFTNKARDRAADKYYEIKSPKPKIQWERGKR